MSCRETGSTGGLSVVSYLRVLLIGCASLLAAPAANAVDSGDIVVVSSKGEVHISVNGAERKLRAGGVLELPASLRTGRDGSVELKQGATTVSIGPESQLDFPALEKRGAPIDRIVQPGGNAFYNIGKREGRKLRVETPYLVAVIKGTQFNVAARSDATTISLFEGLLEVRAADDSSVIDLKAGEIATRKQGDKSIGVLKMDAGKAPPTGSRPSPGGESGGTLGTTAPRVAPPEEGEDLFLADRDTIDSRTDLNVTANVPAIAGPGVDLETAVGVDAGPVAEVAVNAAVDVPAGTLDASIGTTVDASSVAGLGASASVDLASGAVDATANTGIDAGPLTTDVALTTGADLPSGSVDAGVTVGAGAPGVQVDVGAAAAVDAVAGTVNVGLDVLGTGIDVGVDLGLDDDHGNDSGVDSSNSGKGSDNQGSGNSDLGNLLDGVLRRSGKK